MSSGLSPVEDPVAGPHFRAARQGRLAVQRCDDCGALRWPPLVGCPECRSRATTWVDVAPEGAVWSFVVYHRAFQAELAGDIPYTVAVVELDAGPHVVGRFQQGGERPTIGQRVTADFVERDGVPSLLWRAM